MLSKLLLLLVGTLFLISAADARRRSLRRAPKYRELFSRRRRLGFRTGKRHRNAGPGGGFTAGSGWDEYDYDTSVGGFRTGKRHRNAGPGGGFTAGSGWDEFVGTNQCGPLGLTCPSGTTCGNVDPRATYARPYGVKPPSPNCLTHSGGCGGCADVGGCMANYGWGCDCC